MKTRIILPAFTGSEWDSVDFFTTEVDTDELNRIDDKIHFLKKEFPDLANARLYATGEFYCADEDGNTPLDDETLKIGDFDRTPYTQPENRIELLQMKVYGDGWVMFSAYGKHTGEEFWTEGVSINSIIAKINELKTA